MTFTIKPRKSIFIGCLFWIIFLASCSSTANGGNIEEVETEVVPTATSQVVLALPTETPEEVNECLNCHSDKQALIDTAKPEEEVVSENEGAG
ncbi:hypothetical protein KQH54_01825 [bacterium]|nr:hypothetical protein [bacterium]